MRGFVIAAFACLTALPALAQTAQPVVPPSSQGVMPNGAPTAPPAAGTGMNPTATGMPVIPTAPPACNQVTNAQGNPSPAHALSCNTQQNPPLRTVTPPHQ